MVPGVPEGAALLSSIKAASDIAKAMIGLRDAEAFRAKSLELQTIILSAQESALSAQAAQMALIKREGDLEAELTRMKAWDGEKERYELREVGAGSFAYQLKAGMEQGEPSHQLCAQCYQRHQKSILQLVRYSAGRTEVLVCHSCGAEVLKVGTADHIGGGGSRPSPRGSRR